MTDIPQHIAQGLFEEGGFVILTDLPQGSEFGIDGTYHITRRFSGIKFLPPGLHLITWSPPPSSTPGPSTIPIRSAIIKITKAKERLVLAYDAKTENIISHNNEETVISLDHLRSLDKELAAYPFDGLQIWQRLTSYLKQEDLDSVIGPDSHVDGMMQIEGEEDDSTFTLRHPSDKNSTIVNAEAETRNGRKKLKFPVFNLKRSWKDGAFGEEVTRCSKDKSWLFGNVVTSQLKGDPYRLLAYFQLSFILLLNLSSYSCLLQYRKLLSLLTRSSDILLDPSAYLTGSSTPPISQVYVAFIQTLSAQLEALPETVFETELPEMDLFYLDELGYLKENIVRAFSGWTPQQCTQFRQSWEGLQMSAKRFHWELPKLEEGKVDMNDSGDEDEEGEYAPVIVET